MIFGTIILLECLLQLYRMEGRKKKKNNGMFEVHMVTPLLVRLRI